jgi:hypothetical protein
LHGRGRPGGGRAARPARRAGGAPGARELPFGIRAFEGFEPNDLVLYADCSRAVVAGDTLIDRGDGLQVHPDRPVEAVSAEDVVRRFRPLLDVPVDLVLPRTPSPPIARRSSGRCRSDRTTGGPLSTGRDEVS